MRDGKEEEIMITFICDTSAETHLITNIKAFNPSSLTVNPDMLGENRIKVEFIVSKKNLAKVIDYLKDHYLKQYNGSLVYITDYYTL